MSNKYTFFWLSPSPFSQWHPSIFEVKGVKFTSAEQFMMYCKAKFFKDEGVAREIISLNKIKGNILNRFLNNEIKKEEIFSNKETKDEWDFYQKKIKGLGRKVKNYNEELWVENRMSYVARGNYEKFTQNPMLKETLLDTGDTIMCEASPFDTIWGCGLKSSDRRIHDEKNWTGLNLLGIILTKLKQELKLESNLDKEQKTLYKQKRLDF